MLPGMNCNYQFHLFLHWSLWQIKRPDATWTSVHRKETFYQHIVVQWLLDFFFFLLPHFYFEILLLRFKFCMRINRQSPHAWNTTHPPNMLLFGSEWTLKSESFQFFVSAPVCSVSSLKDTEKSGPTRRVFVEHTQVQTFIKKWNKKAKAEEKRTETNLWSELQAYWMWQLGNKQLYIPDTS